MVDNKGRWVDRYLAHVAACDRSGSYVQVDLVEALKRKETAAFEQLIAQHGPMLYRVALRLMGQREEAEDVLQETLLKVHQHIHTFDGRAALTTWLYRIVVNTSLLRLRSKSRPHEALLDTVGPRYTEDGDHADEVADWALPPEQVLLRQEALSVLRQGIERLPELYRAVYVLAEVEGLPHQEIAGILDLTVGAVKTRLHRARLFLRELLADYFAERKGTSP
jgi:RNA polymerase sigma-70 factor, ECF subfamily